jgi:hypothetical protein
MQAATGSPFLGLFSLSERTLKRRWVLLVLFAHFQLGILQGKMIVLMMKGCHNLLQNLARYYLVCYSRSFWLGAQARGFDRSVRHARAFSNYHSTQQRLTSINLFSQGGGGGHNDVTVEFNKKFGAYLPGLT